MERSFTQKDRDAFVASIRLFLASKDSAYPAHLYLQSNMESMKLDFRGFFNYDLMLFAAIDSPNFSHDVKRLKCASHNSYNAIKATIQFPGDTLPLSFGIICALKATRNEQDFVGWIVLKMPDLK